MKAIRFGGLPAAAAAIAFVAATAAAAGDRPQPFLPDIIISSTVPANGDLNPYGVAIVPWGFPAGGTIAPGDVLVSNFNAVTSARVIASGYSVAPNMAALILGPTGLAYDAASDVLYVASTNDNAIFAVPHAGYRTGSSGTGAVIFRDQHLRGPLALVFAPNGDLLTANGDAVNPDPTQPSEIVEFTKKGRFVAQSNVDAAQGGAFGIGVAKVGPDNSRLVVIDDNANDMTVLDRNAQPGD